MLSIADWRERGREGVGESGVHACRAGVVGDLHRAVDNRLASDPHTPARFFYATTSQRLARRRGHEGRPRRVCVVRCGQAERCGAGVCCGVIDVGVVARAQWKEMRVVAWRAWRGAKRRGVRL